MTKGVKIEHRIGIQASITEIWDVVSDLERWPEWNPLYPKAKGILRIGSQLDLEVAVPGSNPRAIRPVILDWIPNEQIHWRLSMFAGLLKSLRFIEIEALTETGSVFTNGELFQGPLGPTLAKQMRKPLRAGFAAMGEALKARVKSPESVMIDELYSARLLGLAANVSRLGRLPHPEGSAEKVSKLCGSRILVDVALKDGRVADFAQEVKACALGQAAASILAEHVIGATVQEIEVAREALRVMLKSGGSPPEGRFSDLAMLEPVKDYPPRHASTMLAFEAAVEACRRAEDARRTSAADAA